MAKKRPRGRPKNQERRRTTWFRYTEATLDELDVLVTHCSQDAPPFHEISRRDIIAALIHRAKQDVDAGRLSYGELFGVTADAGK